MGDDSSSINPDERDSNRDDYVSDVFVYEFGPFRFTPSDPTDLRLVRAKTPVHLSPMEFRLLSFLVENSNRQVTKDEVIEHLWNLHNVTIHAKLRKRYGVNVDTYIFTLGKKLGGKEDIYKKPRYQLKPQVKTLKTSVVAPFYDATEFDEWAFSETGGRITLAFGIVIGLSFLYLFLHKYFAVEPLIIVSAIQSGVIAFALLASFWIFTLKNAERAHGLPKRLKQTALKEYLRYWKFLLWSWLFLYLSLALLAYVRARESQSATFYKLSIAVTFFNNCNSLAIALCYLCLKHPHDQRRVRLTTRAWIAGVIILLLFVAIEYRLLFPSSAMAQVYLGAANFTSGIVGGLTLTVYVKLLKRRFLYTNPWIPVAFYFYALIQPLYFLITDIGEVWIVEVALVLKCLLCLYTLWLFKSGRLVILFSADKT
jgi:hypothetical protein